MDFVHRLFERSTLCFDVTDDDHANANALVVADFIVSSHSVLARDSRLLPWSL